MRNAHCHTASAALCELAPGEAAVLCCLDEDLSRIYVATDTGDVAAFPLPTEDSAQVRRAPAPCSRQRGPPRR
jgi:hypothetical protein